MPDLQSPMHLDMLRGYRRRGFVARLRGAVKAFRSRDLYGLQWGDPDTAEPLRFIRDHYVRPYVNAQHRALEIGPGGGRWTRYLLGFKELYVVDYHQELLDELKTSVSAPNMTFVRNSGCDFPGIGPRTVDYVFSFGTFVHLDVDIIEAYLRNLRQILTPDANVVIHYSDKTKVMAQRNEGFSDNTPERMRRIVVGAGYEIVEEDLTTMWHSSVVRFKTGAFA